MTGLQSYFSVFSEHTVSAEGFLRVPSCPVCSAVSATVTWRTPCSKTSLKRKGTADSYVFQLTSIDVITHLQQQEAGFFYCRSCLCSRRIIYFSLCRCLIRLVDDFLLITPDLHDAQAFLKYDTRQVCHMTAHVTQGLSTNMCFGLIHNIFTFQISRLFWTFRKSIINHIIIHTWDEAFSSRDCRRSQMHWDHLNLLSLSLIGSHLFVAVKLLLEGNCCNIIWCSCRTQHKYI